MEQKQAKKKNSQFVSNKELREIAKSNNAAIAVFEKAKKRKNVSESEYTTQMQDESNVLEIDNLHTYFYSDVGVVKAVNGVSFNVPKGSTVGVVGESGCGKSVTSLSMLQLVSGPQGQIVDGEIRFKLKDFVLDEKKKPIPVWACDENGVVLEDITVDKHGRPVVDKKTGKLCIGRKQARDEHGFRVFKQEDKTFNIAKMPISAMRKIRGKEIAMIFQEPMTSLNPVFTIGYQLREAVEEHTPGITREEARERCLEMLGLVGIAMAEHVYDSYPHQLSGGMRQRVMIAMALSCNPKLIIADEPTTALDVTIQAQILELLRSIKKDKGTSIMLITHDLGVIAEMADYVVVMYAGRVIEKGTVFEIFDRPLHPYTKGLQKSKPVVGATGERLYSIPGQVPNPINMPKHCYFYERCKYHAEHCKGSYPELVQISPTHQVSCHNYKRRLEEYEKAKIAQDKGGNK